MLNYIKSEIYRVTHTKEIYLTAGILAALAALLQVLLYFFGGPYRNTSFSYSNLVASPMLFGFMGGMVAVFLYEGGRRNGNLKNTVAGGVPRNKIFVGQCVVSLLTATAVMALVMAVWIFCAEMLLPKEGPVKLSDLLMEIPMVYLTAAACLISSVLFLEFFDKSGTTIIIWLSVWIFVPKLLMYLGFRFDVVYDLALWMPVNFFDLTNGANVNTRECLTAWDTLEGAARCLISGLVGTAVFGVLGMKLLKKRDL